MGAGAPGVDVSRGPVVTPHRDAVPGPDSWPGSFASRLHVAVRRSGRQLDAGQSVVLDALAEPVPHGFYLWGDVGRGKTMLADLYAEARSDRRVLRVHIHAFLRELHRQIAVERAPLADVLSRLLGRTQVLIFDEFHVHDVADAVFLTAVLEFVLDHRILLVATSNYPPQGLLPDPLFHHRMEPAIALIERHLTVVGIGDGPDHRVRSDLKQRSGFAAGNWVVAGSEAVDADRWESGNRKGAGDSRVRDGAAGETIRAAGIPVRALRIEGAHIVFSFADLCEQAVGTHQYLWIAEQFAQVSVTDVPDLATVRRDALLRFALLVDVLCDADTPLSVRAAAEPARILEADVPPRDAARTLSRLALLVG